MSAPPMSSPLTKTCGIVGQPEICGELLADPRIGEDVDGRDRRAGGVQRLERAVRVAAHDHLRRPLHEDGHGLVVDDVRDLLVEGLHAVPFVLIRSSWMEPSPSGAASASLTRRC